ncbi:MAG TPA: site-2 protease family protein, partial [Chroococcales cyanobacterium]
MDLAVFVMVGWILSLCLHEFCHALVAYLGGDTTVKEKGYLTLNPLRYTDARMTLILPAIMLAMGGIALPGAAVYINTANLRNRFWDSLVSLAGPVGSIIATYLLAIPFLLQLDLSSISWMKPALAVLIDLECAGIMLNLLPFPPLDGFGIIEPWLPKSVRQSARQFGGAGLFIVFGIFWFVQPANQLLWDTADGLAVNVFHAPRSGIGRGYRMFREQSMVLIVLAILLAILLQPTAPKAPKA